MCDGYTQAVLRSFSVFGKISPSGHSGSCKKNKVMPYAIIDADRRRGGEASDRR